ncbi:MAG: FKBP-type peptidyl-prolyl cis-trans isomerase [Paludibacteraceae bacterium]|nr:FKBP-type peptidyl-prolyl cis-trans isomerase [Paludibacteraceae bacterium]
MKKILFLFFVVLLFVSCDERFMSWREYNEEWIVVQKDKLGVDTNVVEVEILPSGVLIEKYHTGFGAIPKPSIDPVMGVSSAVKVKYTGWLVDGTRFDYSDDVSFYLSDVVEGWQEALSLMPQGSHWKIYIPHEKAYGEKGSKGLYRNFSVPPYSALIFEVRLIEVKNY